MTQTPTTSSVDREFDDAVPTVDGDAGEQQPAGAPGEDRPAGSSDADAEPPEGSPEGNGRPTAAQRLEEEGDVAADYLEELLDITDVDGDIDIDVENGRAAVSIVADQGDPVSVRELNRLVGTDGQVLEALQDLTRLAVQAKTGERSRLMLDVAGFRLGRRSELERVAGAAVQRVQSTGAAVTLEPMSPFERKVVHDVVAAAGLLSESTGEGDARRVVVLPSTA